MAWKPTRQLLIEFPDHPPEAADALQDDHTGTDPGTAGTAREAEGPEEGGGDGGPLRSGTEGQPRRLEGPARPGEPGSRVDSDQERGDGAGPGGGRGGFSARILNGRGHAADVTNDAHPPTHAARIAASR